MAFSFFTKLLFSVTVLTVITSCAKNNEEANIPQSVLSEEQFAKLLVDFALAESTSNINVKNLPADKMDSVYNFDPLIDNHVSKSAYDSTITFYSKHPALYKRVYENVLTELSKMQVKKDSVKVDPVSK
ncbi:MAG: DUF4296 domain-containing protein [Bacteroidia bacterium]|nr:DUF4296 domain-containing protein [Bacteroidia bacterium]